MAIVSKTLLSFLSLLAIFTSLATSQPGFLKNYCIDTSGNYTANSAYHANLNTLLSNLTSNARTNYGFFNFSEGENTDKVNVIAMCRGNLKRDECFSCLNESRVLLTQACPNQKEAITWFDNCMLRYSNRNIFGVMEPSPFWYRYSLRNSTDGTEFNLGDLLGRLRDRAASGGSLLKFAEGQIEGTDCNDCLAGIIDFIPKCCVGKIRGRFMQPSCNLRFDNFPYYNSISTDAPPPMFHPPAPSIAAKQGKSKASRTAVAIVVPVVSSVLLLILICIYLRVRKSRDQYTASEIEVDNEIKNSELMQFDFKSIKVATNNFSEENKLGRGGFGTVYKGWLSDGQEVAIKRLAHNSGQGQTEFKNEVLLTGKLQHRNLVRLLGFCLEKKERLLVYEFVPNKSLDYIIFDPIKRANLDWEVRFKIIKGIARGLLYLHEDSRLQIVHRDIKLSNILLDEELNPKISDFGTARLFAVNQTEGNTNTIVGTFGYMAPEYIKHGQYSVKSDVFSFGMMILEIICGKRNNEIRHGEIVEGLLSMAWSNWRGETISNIVDPTLNHDDSGNEIMRCIHIGLLCVQEDIANRPTMTSVLSMLNSSSFPLPDPSELPFLLRSRRLLSIHSGEQYSETTRSSDSRSQSTQEATNKSQITDVYPR